MSRQALLSLLRTISCIPSAVQCSTALGKAGDVVPGCLANGISRTPRSRPSPHHTRRQRISHSSHSDPAVTSCRVDDVCSRLPEHAGRVAARRSAPRASCVRTPPPRPDHKCIFAPRLLRRGTVPARSLGLPDPTKNARRAIPGERHEEPRVPAQPKSERNENLVFDRFPELGGAPRDCRMRCGGVKGPGKS